MMTLFELRKSAEITQHQNISASTIASRAGISRQKYRRFERGQGIPNVIEASQIAMVFNIQLIELVGIIRATVKPGIASPDPSLN